MKDGLRLAGMSTVEPFAGVTKIDAAVARELTAKAAIAVVLSMLAIIGYIWFRFEFRFGLGAVIAMIHDILITIGLLVLFGYEFDLTIIAALLTIVGYSVNDTIVVFDRIRENRGLMRKSTMAEIIDVSINQTLSRTLLTSVTVMFGAVALYVWAGSRSKASRSP